MASISGKRPAEVSADARTQKRAKDIQAGSVSVTALTSHQPQSEPSGTRAKRTLHEVDPAVVCADGGDAQRVLRASELENSIQSITAALRWRSPVKPYKLPRLHGPESSSGRPTAVRGIVDVGDEEHEPGSSGAASGRDCHRQQQQQQRRPSEVEGQQQARERPGAAEASGRGGAASGSGSGSGSQPEWGQLFASLSLGGCGRSQRTDPIWAAVGNNRAAAGSATGKPRSTLAGPDPQAAPSGPAQATGDSTRTSSGSTPAPAAGVTGLGTGRASHVAPRRANGAVEMDATDTEQHADAGSSASNSGAAGAAGVAVEAAKRSVAVVWSNGSQAFSVVCPSGSASGLGSSEPAVSVAMEASPVRGGAAAVGAGPGAVAATAASVAAAEGGARAGGCPTGQVQRRSNGGFLAQEANRLRASASVGGAAAAGLW